MAKHYARNGQNISLIPGVHCGKSIRIRSFSGPYFPAFGRNTERYGVSEYGHFSRSGRLLVSEETFLYTPLKF